MSQFVYMKCQKIYTFIFSKSVISKTKFIPVNFLSHIFIFLKVIIIIIYRIIPIFLYTKKYGPENSQLVILEEFIGTSIFQLAEKDADCVKNIIALIKINQINAYVVLIVLKTGIKLIKSSYTKS